MNGPPPYAANSERRFDECVLQVRILLYFEPASHFCGCNLLVSRSVFVEYLGPIICFNSGRVSYRCILCLVTVVEHGCPHFLCRDVVTFKHHTTSVIFYHSSSKLYSSRKSGLDDQSVRPNRNSNTLDNFNFLSEVEGDQTLLLTNTSTRLSVPVLQYCSLSTGFA